MSGRTLGNRVMRFKLSERSRAFRTAPTSSLTSPTSPRRPITRSAARARITAAACGSTRATASSTSPRATTTWRRAAEPDVHRRQGAAHRQRRQGRRRQQAARGLRPARLHLRSSQPPGHRLPPRDQPPDHRRERPVAHRRDHRPRERRKRRLGPAAQRGVRADCPDDYCGYSPNQMDAMDRSRARRLHAHDGPRHLP